MRDTDDRQERLFKGIPQQQKDPSKWDKERDLDVAIRRLKAHNDLLLRGTKEKKASKMFEGSSASRSIRPADVDMMCLAFEGLGPEKGGSPWPNVVFFTKKEDITENRMPSFQIGSDAYWSLGLRHFTLDLADHLRKTRTWELYTGFGWEQAEFLWSALTGWRLTPEQAPLDKDVREEFFREKFHWYTFDRKENE